MFERVRTVVSVVIPVVAIAVIVVGLWPRPDVAVDPEARVRAVAANIKCPFCSGESIAESTSSVAADYEVLIAEWVDQGVTDDEIYRRFEDRFGRGILLDAGGAGWGLALWIIPGIALVAGLGAIVGLRRKERSSRPQRAKEPVA